MDISVLTEQRRENVINLLKGMKIRKSDGDGFDKDDVYACMQQLCDVYEKSIDDLTLGYETELGELQDKYQKYDENNDLYISLIMEAKKSSNEIINQAKTEVDEILKNGKEKIQEQEAQMEQFRIDSEKERESISAELKASKDVAEAEKAAIRVEMEAEKEKLEATKNKYRQQINSMEEEFADIKTNILRTSGKIDSLKSKLPADDEEINWNVSNDVDAVDFPAEDVAVEDIIPTEEIVIEAVEGEVEVPANNDTVEEAVSLDDLMPVEDPIAELPEVEEPAVEEISLDEFEIEEFVIEDVPAVEPMAETNPLRHIKDSEKLIITPHIAWASIEARTRLMQIICNQIKEYFGL